MTVLGVIVQDLMKKQGYTVESLAAAASVPVEIIRDLQKYGIDPRARAPKAPTLRRVAQALGVDPLRLFQGAGYIVTGGPVPSSRSEYFRTTFDSLSEAAQEQVIRLIVQLKGEA